MDEVKLALELDKVVHNECKDVPHDIGLRLLDVVKKHLGEQLNLPTVIKSVCDDYFPSFDKPNTCLHCGFFKHEHS